jgi:L-phenylalanine/L-methionine N-acetyltransferase
VCCAFFCRECYVAGPINIRSCEPSDAEAISRLFGSEGVFEGTVQMPLVPIASRLEMFTKVDTNNCKLVAMAGDDCAGYASLFQVSPSLRAKHRRGLALVVAKPWQGQGVGGQLLTQLLDWTDNWAGILRVELTVYTDNERAIRLYQRHGFVQEGCLRAYALRGGQFVDALSMARLHPKPPMLPKV